MWTIPGIDSKKAAANVALATNNTRKYNINCTTFTGQ